MKPKEEIQERIITLEGTLNFEGRFKCLNPEELRARLQELEWVLQSPDPSGEVDTGRVKRDPGDVLRLLTEYLREQDRLSMPPLTTNELLTCLSLLQWIVKDE